ncbi:MAG: hypothetical protein PHP73_03435 [Candidatus Omnitrophica bacterium]|nr:hypothetical protein [Candidatus Omnitrophota bacterium]
MLILLLMNLIVLANAAILAKYLFRISNRIDYFLGIFILYFSQIVITLELLGVFGLLKLNNVILINLFVLVISLGVIKFAKVNLKNSAIFQNTGININNITRLCLAVLLGFGLVKIIINLFNPPFGWDDLNYHFTFPVEWLKNHNLDNPISISGDPSVSYYPVNGSLFFLWFILPLKNVFLADLGQLPFFIAAFFTVVSLARKLNLSKEFSFYAAVLFSLIPNYFKQLQIAYIDIIVAALFLIALNYLFLINKEGKVRNVILCSLAIGLSIGTKTTAMPIILLLLLPLLYLCFSKNTGYKKMFALTACFLPILAVGGFSYIKNFILTHNPLYPLNLKIAGHTIFRGVVDSVVYRTGIRPGDFNIAKFLFHEGLGGQTLIFVLPAIVLACPILLFKNRKTHSLLMDYLLILPFLIILTFRFVIPLPNIRYIYALFAVGILIFFYAAEAFKIQKLFLKILVALCVIGSIPELAKKYELIAGLILSLTLFFTFGSIIKLLKKNFKLKIIILCILTFLSLVFIEKFYIKNEFPSYSKMVKYSGFWPDAAQAWNWLNDNTTGNNIAYIGRPVGFPLYGTNFKNNVYYVSINKVEPAMLHYFPDSKYIWGYNGNKVFRNFESPENYRGNADYNVWLANLKNKRIDFLFVYSELIKKTDDFPIEDKWAIAHPEIFNPVFKNSTIRIYKLKFNKD